MIYDFQEQDFMHIYQCYDRVFEPYHLMPDIHYHPGIEIMYVVNGNCSVEFFTDENGDKIEETHHLFPGDFIFLESSRFHRPRVSETGARIKNVQVLPVPDPLFVGQRSFGKTIQCDDSLSELFRNKPNTFRLYDSMDIFNTLSLLIEKYVREPSKHALHMYLMLALLIDVATLYMRNLRKYRGYSYIKRAVYLIENTMGTITPDELATAVGVSRSYLPKLFRECFQKSIGGYIAEFRIMRACNRFRLFPEIKVADMATELKFGNVLGFERMFKRIAGLSPTEFKKKVKQSDNTWILREKVENL